MGEGFAVAQIRGRPHLNKEYQMNNERMKGNWNQFKGKIKEKWGRLTDDDLDVAEGQRDQLIGRIQERYGIAKEEAERQFAELEKATYSSRV
jgi:uncharacterized protein YjbJ (UPF0337 family)